MEQRNSPVPCAPRDDEIIYHSSTGESLYPFHICTDEQESRVIFRNEQDLSVGVNHLVVCAKRHKVLIVAYIVMSTHIHSYVLARRYDEAKCFIDDYKRMYSMYFRHEYGIAGIFSRVEPAVIHVDCIRYARNVLAYIHKNAYDAHARVEEYRWSSFNAFFRKPVHCSGREVREMSRREIRLFLRVDMDLSDTEWKLDNNGIIIPGTSCLSLYLERIFNGDFQFFMKRIALVDNDEMEEKLVHMPLTLRSDQEFLKIAEEKSLETFGMPLNSISKPRKLHLLKIVAYSVKSTIPQIARCFGLSRDEVASVLKRRRT